MKFTGFFCTRLYMFLSEIPVIAFLWLAIANNDAVDLSVKLYPLQAVLIAIGVFIILFLFRMITVSNQEIRMHGLFSSKDRAIINKGKTLTVTLLRRRRIRFELFGAEEKPPFDWMKSVDYIPSAVRVFRATAIGGRYSARRLLSFFGADKDMIKDALTLDEYTRELDGITLDSRIVDGERKIKLIFNKTI
ncbi:MAG: hypothetical protein IJY65_03845 [Clostridia bacterium]|nr:hypothetical protein [Clostridia bacterium]